MKSVMLILFVAVLFLSGCSEQKGINELWIEKALSADINNKQQIKELIDEFILIHKDNKLLEYQKGMLSSGEEESMRVLFLSAEKVNLDQDDDLEVIIQIRANYSDTKQYVSDKKEKDFQIIFENEIYTHMDEPEILTAALSDRTKIFYFKRINSRGSGAWLNTYDFYRMLNGEVKKVLEVVKTSNFALGTDNIQQNSKTNSVKVTDDKIVIDFEYDIYAPYEMEKKLRVNDSDGLFKGNENFVFEWNDKENIYALAKNDDFKLNEKQLEYFKFLGDDEKFVDSFRKELLELGKEKKSGKGKIARYLLKKVSAK